MQSHTPGRALDLGCGTGTNVITLARAGWEVTGVDFAPRAIRLARQKARQAGIRPRLAVADVTRLTGLTGPYDLALDIGCFHALAVEERDRYVAQLDRVLASGGAWLLYAFLAPGTPRSGHGLGEVEIDRLSTRFGLTWRRAGRDRRDRPSAWFLFQKPRSA